jgi:hypothetical protein
MNAPFVFMTSIQSVQLTGRRAKNLEELYLGIEEVDGSSIYHHTYRFLRHLHFIRDIPRSDFAFWINENLKEEIIAEKIMSLDLRDFPSIRSLRESILSILSDEKKNKIRWIRDVLPGMEFHFCRSTSIVLQAGYTSHNIEEFIDGISRVDAGSFFYHLVESPLRLEVTDPEYKNDFSRWIGSEMNLADEAGKIAHLDPYGSDMEKLRKSIIDILSGGSLRSIVKKVLDRQQDSEMNATVRAIIDSWKK